MIGVDTSTIRRYLDSEEGPDVHRLRESIQRQSACVPPVVITECLSSPKLEQAFVRDILALPVLELRMGYWERAGRLRARLLAEGFKANLADTLIAQSCIDHDVPLITHDRDFRHFVKAGLKLL